jgi:hypothetical protein
MNVVLGLVARRSILVTASVLVAIAMPAPASDAATPPAKVVHVSGFGCVPTYSVSGGGSVTEVGFRVSGDNVQAIDQEGDPVAGWPAGGITLPQVAESFNGGFDYDQDGWPDFSFVIRGQAPAEYCLPDPQAPSYIPLYDRYHVLYSGRTGVSTIAIGALRDHCSGAPRWTTLEPLFGTGPELAFVPARYTQGWFASYEGGGWNARAMLQPNTSSWDYYYSGAASPYLNEPGTNLFLQPFNGVIANVGNEKRLIAWTLQRVMQFRFYRDFNSPQPKQLAADYPYISGWPGATVPGPAVQGLYAGRNYGLVTKDPASERISLIAGTDVAPMADDMRTGTLCTDPSQGAKDCWGGLERHVSVYVPSSNGIQDTYLSISTDSYDGQEGSHSAAERATWHKGRVQYPANPIVSTPSGPSRLAYSIYDFSDPGHWNIHITPPGGSGVDFRIADRFLWDIRDVDGDGTDEWLTSPVCTQVSNDPVNPHVPACPGSGWYFPLKRIDIGRWNNATNRLVHERTIDGVFPYLIGTFRKPTISTSRASLFPVLTVQPSPSDPPKLLVTSNGTTTQLVDLGP